MSYWGSFLTKTLLMLSANPMNGNGAEIETAFTQNGMAPTFCSRCGDAVEEGCDPWDELAELDALLERLRLKRYDLKRKINRLQSPIVRQLPPDVMSTIFEFCLPDFTEYQNLPRYGLPSLPDTEEGLSIPLSLGAICSYWRGIAWSTPSLWCSLVVRVTRKHADDPHIVTGIAQGWLSRSGQLPLSIRICSKLYEPSRVASAVSALAEIINQYSTRWSDLDLYIPDSYQHFHATDNHAPILKSIQFNGAYQNRQQTTNFQLTCPRLESFPLIFWSKGNQYSMGQPYTPHSTFHAYHRLFPYSKQDSPIGHL
jgi:hypothetical protein